MNNSFDMSILQKLTEDPEIMSKAMQMASMLAGSDMFKNLGALSGNSDRFEGTLNRIDDSPSQGNFEAEPRTPPGLPGGPGEGRPASGGKRIPGTHEQRIRLLEAMRPFVPEDRRPKIDFIIKLLGLLHVANELGLKNIL